MLAFWTFYSLKNTEIKRLTVCTKKNVFNIDNKKKCLLKTKSEYWNDFSLEPRDTEDWSSESICKYI